MSITIGLLRHAKSDWDDMAKRDFDRGLNDRGRRGAALMGRHIAEHGVKWDVVLASPAERVRRTLEAALPDAEPVFDKRLYLASGDMILDVVGERLDDGKRILVAGHNPGLQDALLALVPPSNENALFDEAKVKFPTATFALIAIEGNGPELAERGTLTHFARPRDLDPELGPVD